MKQPAYTFISYPYECDLGSSPDVTITQTIHTKDVSLSEMLVQFESFLRAVGYHIESGDYLDFVNDEPIEEEDYLDFVNDEPLNGVTRVEVVDDISRAYQNYNVRSVCLDVQDEGKTLKVFIR